MNQTHPLPASEWFTIIRETEESRLFRNITQAEFEEGCSINERLDEARLWFGGLVQ